MREILFRGKADKWVYGYFVQALDIENKSVKSFIIKSMSSVPIGGGCVKQDYYEIDLETLGQYTGLKDEDGVKIFEGDYIKMHYFFENYNPHTLGAFEDENCVEGVVICDINGFYIIDDGEMYPLSLMQDSEAEAQIVGNIYDNPELVGDDDNKQ